MEIKPIRTEDDYDAMLARIYAIFDAEPGTEDGDELDVLFLIVEEYERKHYPIEPLDPVSSSSVRWNFAASGRMNWQCC